MSQKQNYNRPPPPPLDLPPSYDAATADENPFRVHSTSTGPTTTTSSTTTTTTTTSFNVNHNTGSNSNSSSSSSSIHRPPPAGGPSFQQQRPMWSERPPEPKPYNDNGLPWTYPPRYFCNKCKNTGYKIKDGKKTTKSCKDCWSKFAKNSNIKFTPSYTPQPQQILSVPFTNFRINDNFTTSMGPQPPQFIPVNIPPPPPPPPLAPPRLVRPGDPSIGGVLCGACRGSGRIYGIFDDSLCSSCYGVGRILR